MLASSQRPRFRDLSPLLAHHVDLFVGIWRRIAAKIDFLRSEIALSERGSRLILLFPAADYHRARCFLMVDLGCAALRLDLPRGGQGSYVGQRGPPARTMAVMIFIKALSFPSLEDIELFAVQEACMHPSTSLQCRAFFAGRLLWRRSSS